MNENVEASKLEDMRKSIVVSSRVRLARNLEDYNFPNKLETNEAKDIISKVKKSLDGYDINFDAVIMAEADMLYKEYLLENHLISKEMSEETKGAVFINEQNTLSIMVNEEDHLRIQALLPGLHMDNAYEMCDKLDDLLEKNLRYAFRENLGYLTSCPTNLGTGMRASVMVHLPALVEMGFITPILENATQIGLAVRGLYGEGTKFIGSLFQVSNQLTLGFKEEEIVNSIMGITRQIIEKEIEAERILVSKLGIVLQDRISRCLGILATSRVMKINESMNYLSEIKLGIRLGWITGISDEEINRIMIKVQPGNQIIDYKAKSQEQIDTGRANLLRTIFKDVDFVG